MSKQFLLFLCLATTVVRADIPDELLRARVFSSVLWVANDVVITDDDEKVTVGSLVGYQSRLPAWIKYPLNLMPAALGDPALALLGWAPKVVENHTRSVFIHKSGYRRSIFNFKIYGLNYRIWLHTLRLRRQFPDMRMAQPKLDLLYHETKTHRGDYVLRHRLDNTKEEYLEFMNKSVFAPRAAFATFEFASELDEKTQIRIDLLNDPLPVKEHGCAWALRFLNLLPDLQFEQLEILSDTIQPSHPRWERYLKHVRKMEAQRGTFYRGHHTPKPK